VSVFLRNLRLQIGLSQSDLARSIGYEQGYVSAVELGLKNPSKEFLARLTSEIRLAEHDLVALADAQKMSNRRFTLPPEVSTATFEFCNELWGKIDSLHPAVLDAMRSMLKLEERVATRPSLLATRVQRRDKKEMTM
jgi:transcriptional regulator with XRE-family HTH domain